MPDRGEAKEIKLQISEEKVLGYNLETEQLQRPLTNEEIISAIDRRINLTWEAVEKAETGAERKQKLDESELYKNALLEVDIFLNWRESNPGKTWDNYLAAQYANQQKQERVGKSEIERNRARQRTEFYHELWRKLPEAKIRTELVSVEQAKQSQVELETRKVCDDIRDSEKSPEVMGRFRELREAADAVQEQLNGLRFNEAIDEEQKILSALGFSEKKFWILKLGKISDAEKQSLLEKGLPEGRIEELIARERSKKHFSDNFDGKLIRPDEMESFRYYTLEDLSQKNIEAIELLRSALGDINNPDSLKESLQEIEKHGVTLFIVPSSFKEPHGNEKNSALIETAAKLRFAISHYERELERVQRIKETHQSGVFPGIIEGKGLYLSYLPPSDFRTWHNSPLAETGIVSGSSGGGSSLEHEFKHLDDYMFLAAVGRKNYREEYSHFITEINSYMIDVRDGHRTWSSVKATLIDNPRVYMGRHQDGLGATEAGEKLRGSIDVVDNLQKAGISDAVISLILMHSEDYDDILRLQGAWESPKALEEIRKLEAEILRKKIQK